MNWIKCDHPSHKIKEAPMSLTDVGVEQLKPKDVLKEAEEGMKRDRMVEALNHFNGVCSCGGWKGELILNGEGTRNGKVARHFIFNNGLEMFIPLDICCLPFRWTHMF
jgi:hypothetical protein